MKSKTTLILLLLTFLVFSKATAQINLGERALGALQNGMAAFTFSDEDAANLSKAAVKKLDSTNTVAGPKDGYTLRLNRVFGKHSTENGLKLNYKVYLTKDVNAFATADGSVRVFSGLMDIMDDTELLAVIGHEIGHVANHDSKDAMKAAYRKAAIIDAAASQSDKIAKLTDGQLGQIGSAIIDNHFSRKQESQADAFAYDFLKINKYDVNAEEAAFNLLVNLSQGESANILTKMMSNHPDSKERAEIAKGRAQADGLYKPYVAKVINNKATSTKVPAKKATKKK